jgi:hypothetical protein
MIELFPTLRRLAGQADLDAVQAAATRDDHVVLAPTHVVVRGGDIVGYGSLAAVPMLHVWLDSQRVKARESAMLLNMAEGILSAQGLRNVIVPCDPRSPFHPYMEKLGYTRLGTTTLNLKGL